MKLTIGKKLGIGFGDFQALMVISAIHTNENASAIKETQKLITSMRVPTIKACTDLQRDLNQSQNKEPPGPFWRETNQPDGRPEIRPSSRRGTISERMSPCSTNCPLVGRYRPTVTGLPKPRSSLSPFERSKKHL